jgi:hypothetical protein
MTRIMRINANYFFLGFAKIRFIRVLFFKIQNYLMNDFEMIKPKRRQIIY